MDQHSTLLTALPPEIRNDICERLLIHTRPIKIEDGQSDRNARVLLDVCRQLKREFSSLYYARNVFACQCKDADIDREAKCTTNLVNWLRRIGPRNRWVLREIQIHMFSKRTFTQEDLFPFLRDQNVRLAREVGWLPLSVLRVRVQGEWLTQLELSELMLTLEVEGELERLKQYGSSTPKGPDIMFWKRDIFDPVIDKYSKPGGRQLSEYVCPATWRYHARTDLSSEEEGEAEVEIGGKKEKEVGCWSGGFKILVSKVRKSKVVVARLRRRTKVSAE